MPLDALAPEMVQVDAQTIMNGLAVSGECPPKHAMHLPAAENEPEIVSEGAAPGRRGS